MLYALIGKPVGHSLSPAIHNALFRYYGIEACYTALEVNPGELEEIVRGLRALSRGFNVTMPYKTDIIRLLDLLAGDAEEIGSVNTVVNRGKLVGFNTDGVGARRALERLVTLKNRKILLLGAGGAGKAIAYELSKDNEVVVLNRTLEKAKALEKFGVKGAKLSLINLSRYLRWAEVLINATSVGMNSDETPVPAEMLRNGLTVMDIVYSPIKTRLLREAETKGCLIIDGLWMLIYQGVESFKLWTGIEANPFFARAVAEKEVARREGHR